MTAPTEAIARLEAWSVGDKFKGQLADDVRTLLAELAEARKSLVDALALTRVDKSINASQGLGTTVSSALEALQVAEVELSRRTAEAEANVMPRNSGWGDGWATGLFTGYRNSRDWIRDSLKDLSSAKPAEGDSLRDELKHHMTAVADSIRAPKPVKTPPDTEHDGGEVLSQASPPPLPEVGDETVERMARAHLWAMQTQMMTHNLKDETPESFWESSSPSIRAMRLDAMRAALSVLSDDTGGR